MMMPEGVTIAVVTALGGIMIALIPLLVRSHRTGKAADVAAHEVRPNNGHSLADTVNRIDRRTLLVSERQERHEQKLDRHLEQAAVESAVIEQLVDIITRGGQPPAPGGNTGAGPVV